MFDRSNYTKEGALHIDVKQLPHDTADAARLYGEMVNRAERQVLDATVTHFGAFNELTVIKIGAERSVETDTQRVRLIFKLNGNLYDFWLDDSDKGAEESLTIVARHLVSQVLNKLFIQGKPHV
jgi:hypothetical protein